MVVENDTPALNDDRRALTEMLFVEGNHICPACEKSGNCELQAVAYHLGMTALRFDHFYPPRDLDASHPDVLLDRNRCILCALCVRASRDVDGKNVFEIGGRGIALAARRQRGVGASRRHQSRRSATRPRTSARSGRSWSSGEAFEVPIGKRHYDLQPIAEVAPSKQRARQRRTTHG